MNVLFILQEKLNQQALARKGKVKCEAQKW